MPADGMCAAIEKRQRDLGTSDWQLVSPLYPFCEGGRCSIMSRPRVWPKASRHRAMIDRNAYGWRFQSTLCNAWSVGRLARDIQGSRLAPTPGAVRLADGSFPKTRITDLPDAGLFRRACGD